MRILALDTALAACSTVLWEDGRIRARSYREMARGQAEVLLPAVVLGLVLGLLLRRRVNEGTLRTVLYLLLFAIGVSMLWRSWLEM